MQQKKKNLKTDDKNYDSNPELNLNNQSNKMPKCPNCISPKYGK